MANTIDLVVKSNGVTVLNETAEATKNAKQELKELQKQMLLMDANSMEFQKAAARAGELKDQMGDAADAIRTSTGPALESMNNTFSIMSGQIANLDFGGLGQSFTSLGRAVGKINFKTLKDELGGLVQGLGNLAGAILSNPLLALGGAVALLVVNFDKINAALSGTAEKVEKLGEANHALEQQNTILDARINKEKTLYGESFKTLALEKEKAQNNVTVAENELAIARTTGDINTIREKENKLIEMRNLLSGITNKGEADRIKLVEEAKNITIAGYKEEQEKQAAVQKFEDARQQQMAVIAEKRRQINAALEVERLSGQEQYKTERANFVQKDIETKKVLVVSDRQKKLQEDLNKLVEEEQILRNAKAAIWTNTTVNELKKEEVKINKENNKEVSKGIDLLEQNAIAAAAELKQEQEIAKEKLKVQQDYARANQSIQANELYELELKKDLELQTWEGAEEDKINITEKYRLAEIEINNKYDDLALQQQIEEQEKLKEAREKQNELNAIAAANELNLLKQSEDAKAQLRVDAMKTSLSIISDLAAAFAGDSERQQKKAFQIQKGVSIATATIDTYLAAQGAYRSQMAISTPDAPVRAAVAAGIAIAQGLARVAIISKQQFNGAGGTSGNNGTGGVPQAGGTQAPSPANFAFVGNQPNQQPPLQAYIVSTQVSSNLEAQQLINNQARLGG